MLIVSHLPVQTAQVGDSQITSCRISENRRPCLSDYVLRVTEW